MGSPLTRPYLWRRRWLGRLSSCLVKSISWVQFSPIVLDVLTPLSDCRQESVEKMERRISGVSYICWMDFHNGILCCGFLCARLISVSFVFSLVSFPATTPRATTPHLYRQGYHAFTTTARLPRLCIYIPATTPLFLVLFLGYHTRAISLHHTRKSAYHARHS